VTLQKEGRAQASVSAGNSGAMMATCLMTLGRIPGISRPAIAVLAPSANKKQILLDCGANVDEKSQNLYDFAICGKVFAEQVLHRENPRVGLLNIGEEEKKGTEVLQETYQRLKASPLNFIGNVEGRGLLHGDADVVVTSGAVGNVALKMMEGFYNLHTQFFGEIDTPAGRKFSNEWNYETYGGAMLLGLNGTGIISHGSSGPEAIKVALKTAAEFAEANVAENIAKSLNSENE
jgi:phosphate acyltransferase